jgi:hypothetical protein
MRVISVLLLSTFLATAVAAQESSSLSFGVAPNVSTLGFGVDVGLGLHSRITVRAGASYMPIKPSFSASDLSWEFSLPETQFMGMVDFFLIGGLRVTGGVRVKSDDISALVQYTGSVDIGDTTYQGTDVGEVTGALVTKDFAPYVGIGFGNVAKRGLGFLLDLGVVLHGAPEVALAASGPIASDPTFQADLEQQRAEFEDDISWVKLYPIVKLGITIGF